MANLPATVPLAQRWKPSVTVAAIIERGGLFLLVEEQTRDGLKLNNPAGHLEQGESPLQGVVREALEETTRVFTPDRFLGVYLSRFQRPGEDITYVRLAFGGTAGEANPALVLDHGIVRTVWMSLTELRASRSRHRSALVLQCIEDYAAGQRLPLESVCTDESVYLDGRV
jgi:phosphatase NudJ